METCFVELGVGGGGGCESILLLALSLDSMYGSLNSTIAMKQIKLRGKKLLLPHPQTI